MGRLSADLGIDPCAILHAPGEVFEALAVAHRDRWTHTDELLALLVEKVDELTILTAQIWSDPKKSPKPPKPYRYPRPAAITKKPKKATHEEILAFFGSARVTRGGE